MPSIERLRIERRGIKIGAMSGAKSSQLNDLRSSAAMFIDRDGTLNEDAGYISRSDQLSLYPWAAEAVRAINRAGLKAIVVTNQSGIARGLYTEEVLTRIHSRMIEELAGAEARIDAIYYCPHHPDVGIPRYRIACDCRKPRSGMLETASRDHNINLERSFVIGDKASDIHLAKNVGARSALVMTGYGRETLSNHDRWPCKPDYVAENLLDAVKQILDRQVIRG